MKPDHIRKRCEHSGKPQYKKYKQAISAVNLVTKQSGRQLYTYKCDYCGYWHLTKSKQGGIDE